MIETKINFFIIIKISEKIKLTFDKKVNLTSKGFHTPEREELLLSSQRPLNTAYKDAYLSTYLPKPANFLS